MISFLARSVGHMSCDVPGVAGKLAHGVHVGDLLGVGVEGKVLGDLPNENLAILGGRGDDPVVERVPKI